MTGRDEESSQMFAQPAFKIGERVRLSELGLQKLRRMRNRPGIVVGYTRNPTAVSIKFDGNKSSTSLHTSYLEADTQK